jgi:hypothetical protein
MNNTTTPKDASQLFCPNWECSARGKVGAGNIVSHGKKRERYKCQTCGKTFRAHQGTMFEGLRKEENLLVLVVTLLSSGCPHQAIVHAFGLVVCRWVLFSSLPTDGRRIPAVSVGRSARR